MASIEEVDILYEKELFHAKKAAMSCEDLF